MKKIDKVDIEPVFAEYFSAIEEFIEILEKFIEDTTGRSVASTTSGLGLMSGLACPAACHHLPSITLQFIGDKTP